MTLEKNVEFAVNIKCQKQVDALKKTLSEIKIEDASISKENKSLVVKSSLPSSQILAKIKGAGFEAAIKGVGPATGENISAAVCVLNNERIKGIIRFVQTSSECIIEGTIEGLSPGKHGINIHEHGDISNSCQNTGQHYNPFNAPHGGPMDPPNERHVGDLGNVEADNHGRAVFVVEDGIISVEDIIGRAVVIHAQEDDLGQGNNHLSKKTGNAGEAIVCGIIARSSGLFQNKKQICACDGTTLWEES